MTKLEREFFPTEEVPRVACAGDVSGLSERVLAVGDGGATRLLYFEPGTDTTANGVQSHDFWEEVYILSGSIHDLRLDRTFAAGDYACRPPGMPHGPWVSSEGAVTFEVRYGRPA